VRRREGVGIGEWEGLLFFESWGDRGAVALKFASLFPQRTSPITCILISDFLSPPIHLIPISSNIPAHPKQHVSTHSWFSVPSSVSQNSTNLRIPHQHHLTLRTPCRIVLNKSLHPGHPTRFTIKIIRKCCGIYHSLEIRAGERGLHLGGDGTDNAWAGRFGRGARDNHVHAGCGAGCGGGVCGLAVGEDATLREGWNGESTGCESAEEDFCLLQ